MIDESLLDYAANRSIGIAKIKLILEALLDGFTPPAIVSVAGTNGKGTTAAALSAILNANSVKVATFTSPHIFTARERLAINQEIISDNDFTCYLTRLQQHLASLAVQPGYFEICFLIACMWFADNACDVWIVEAGIGGLLDCTNALDCDLLLLTQIDYDHMDILGGDLESIAQQKLGLLAEKSILLCAETKQINAISNAALMHEVYILEKDFFLAGGVWQGFNQKIANIATNTACVNSNIALAIAAAVKLSDVLNINIAQINAALQKIKLTARQMRLDLQGRKFYIDVAHNAASCVLLADRLRADGVKSATAIFCCAKNKAAAACLNALSGVVNSVHSAYFDPSMLSVNNLRAMAPDFTYHLSQDKRNLLADVIAATAPGATIVVFGSFKVVAAVLSAGWGFGPLDNVKEVCCAGKNQI
jgi:dihydrofolate synthase / folylpolyglutamate synthase